MGCRLVRPDGMLQHVGTYLPVDSFAGEQIGACERDINQFPGNNDVEGVVFACVYLKRETLNTVGLLDEDYFSYFEDTDYCFRVKERGLTRCVLRLSESDSSRARVHSREWGSTEHSLRERQGGFPAQVGIEAAGGAVLTGNRVAFADELPDGYCDQFTGARYRA